MTIRKQLYPLLAILQLLVFVGCGGIRYTQAIPEAKEFHPQSVAVLSLEARGHKDAEDVLDRLITDALKDRKNLKKVVSLQAVQGLLRDNEELKTATEAYLGKLEEVNFSDSDQSRKIGSLLGVDAFLLAGVDYWYYTREGDQDIAKVGLSMKLINAETGAIVWKAAHYLAPDYVFMKPDLKSIAADVVGRMIASMPR